MKKFKTFDDVMKKANTPEPYITPEKTFLSCIYHVLAGDNKLPANDESGEYRLCCACGADEILKKYDGVEISDNLLKIKLALIGKFERPDVPVMNYKHKADILASDICGKCENHKLSEEFLNDQVHPPKSKEDITSVYDVLSNNDPLP